MPDGRRNAAEAAQVVEVAIPDQADGDRQHDRRSTISTIDPRPAVHRLRDRGEIEMIVAAGGHGRTNEDRVDEQRRCHLLQPQPGMADGARHDVGGDRHREAEAEHAAQIIRTARAGRAPAISDDAAAATPVCRRWSLLETSPWEVVVTHPWRGRVGSHEAKRNAKRGGGSLNPGTARCGETVTPPRLTFAALT